MCIIDRLRFVIVGSSHSYREVRAATREPKGSVNADPGVQWMVRQVLLILRVLRDGLRALTHVLPPRRSNTCDERPVMFRLIWTLSVRTRDYLHRYMPSNRQFAAVHTRRGLKWGIPAMLPIRVRLREAAHRRHQRRDSLVEASPREPALRV